MTGSDRSKATSVVLWVMATAVTAVTVAGVIRLLRQDQQQQQQQQPKQPSPRNRPKNDSENHHDNNNNHKNIKEGSSSSKEIALITERFQLCVERMGPMLSNLPNTTQLEFYGLFKQATLGDAKEYQPSPPPSHQIVAAAKYRAWLARTGMDRPSAMQAYIDKSILYEYTRSIAGGDGGNDENDDDLEGDAVMDMGGMGNKPSTLMYEAADGTANDEEDALHPLHAAARIGNIDDVIRLLKEEKGDGNASLVNSVDSSGQTPLHLAADRGHLNVIQLLVNAGANISVQDHDGIGILQAAVIGGHVDTCQLLLDLGADPHQSDHDGDTPYMEAQSDDELKPIFAHLSPTVTSKTTSTTSTTNGVTKADAAAVEIGNSNKVNVNDEIKKLDEPIHIFLDDDGDM